MIITLLLGVAFFGGLVKTNEAASVPLLAKIILVIYLLFAASHLFSARRRTANFFNREASVFCWFLPAVLPRYCYL
jgi:hypothetical protein